VAQAVPVGRVAQAQEGAQSHAALAVARESTESLVQYCLPAVEYPAAAQKVAVAPAPWASRAVALFSWAVAAGEVAAE